jgi:hypothetical protein
MEDRAAFGMPAEGLDTAATLAWMQANAPHLRELLEEEAEPEGDGAAGGDGPIRAHLRFLAAALEATAPPDLAGALAGLQYELPAFFAEGQELYEEQLARSTGAIALEEHLQFRTSPGSDPSLDAALDRRARLGAWTRLFLLAVEERLGPAADGLAESALTWMGANHRTLAGYVIALDRRGRTALNATPGARSDRDALDDVAQAATVQGHLRLTVDALAAALAVGGR